MQAWPCPIGAGRDRLTLDVAATDPLTSGSRPAQACGQIVRFAWRNAARRPAFTLLVVLTLALGIGVNSAVFALLDAVLLRPLPYRDPSRLVFVWQTLPEHNVFELEATPFDYAAWHGVRSFSSSRSSRRDAFTLTGDDNPERVRGSRVTASLMPLLGIAPQIGRAFTPDEDTDGAAPVVDPQRRSVAAPLRRRSRRSFGRSIQRQRRAATRSSA